MPPVFGTTTDPSARASGLDLCEVGSRVRPSPHRFLPPAEVPPLDFDEAPLIDPLS